ncbi:MAG: hypothetical protein NTX99_04005 [Candidatus Aminicenantes bacterium]|nr:hypothetical protein [Candidatus Aminicenantes bacterium]
MRAERFLPLAAIAAVLVSLAVCGSGAGDRTGPLLVVWDFETGSAEGWRPNDPAHWRVAAADGSKVYELTAPGTPGPVRAPTSVSVLAGHDVASFEFTGRLRCDTDPATAVRDMCVFFHYQDPTHFYYVHFAGTSDGVHNIIGLVDGADRVKINAEPAGASTFRLTDRAWHPFKVTCDAATGEIRAYLDDMKTPILTARDNPLAHGLVGVGSFDDTGAFDDLVLRVPLR